MPLNQLILIALLSLLRPILCAFASPHWNSSEFDNGKYGLYELQEYGSFGIPSPRLNIIQWDQQCEYGYTLLTPRGDSVKQPGPMILDGRGNLIWTDDQWGKTANLQIQKYKGEDFLTFWAGDVVETHGNGSYYMVDSSYKVRYHIKPVGDFDGDLHEFVITPEGTALITIYTIIRRSLLQKGGRDNGYVLDNVFQEIDIASGKKLFEWRASDYFKVYDSLMPLENTGHSELHGFDYFHLNSISKDKAGNYWISSRHFCAIFCISHQDGSIIHTLGGPNNQFHDLSNDAATNFTWQHHMIYHNSESSHFSSKKNTEYITIFDNAAWNDRPTTKTPSRAIVIRLDMSDPARPSAELLKSYTNPTFLQTNSQGSVQVLPPLGSFSNVPSTSGNKTSPLSDNAIEHVQSAGETVFVGWGQAYAYTQYDAQTGRVLCDVHLGASKYFSTGLVKSYRAFKWLNPWKGRPTCRPSIGVWKQNLHTGDGPERIVYASWNGATEVRGWLLQGAQEFLGAQNNTDASGWTNVAALPKEGFEAAFNLTGFDETSTPPAYAYYRVLALSKFHPLSRHTTRDAGDAFEAIGVSGTLNVKKAIVVIPADSSSNDSSKTEQFTDNNGVQHEYIVTSAVYTSHPRPFLGTQAYGKNSGNAAGWYVILAVGVFALVVIGGVVGWREWLKGRLNRTIRRESDKTEKQGLLDKID